MSRLRLAAFLLWALAVLVPLRAQNIERHELPSGLTVVTCELANSHAVEVRVVVRAAPLHEGEWMGSGLSRLLQRMIADNARDPEAAALIRRLGRGLRSATSPTAVTYAIKTVDTQLEDALTLLAGLVGAPRLTEEDLVRVMDLQLRDIADQEKRWESLQDRLLRSLVYAHHPARMAVDGRPEALASLGLDTVKDYHRRRYHTGTTTVIVVGNIGAEGTVARVAKAFAGYPQGSRPLPVVVEEPVRYQAQGVRRKVAGIGNHRHAYAWRTVPFEHRDQLGLDLVAIMLANPDLVDLSRRLTNRLLVTDFAVANHRPPGRAGYLTISYSPAEKRSIEAWEEVAAVLKTLRTAGPGENALAAAKRHWLREFQLSKLNTSVIAADIADWEQSDVDPGYREEMARLVKAITIADIIRVTDKYLHENGRNKQTVILEPPDGEAVIEPALPIPVSDAQPVQVPYDNEATLLKQQMPSLGLTFLRVSLGGGTACETEEERGAAQILAALLAKGPAGEDGQTEAEREAAFRRELAERGMQFDCYATRHGLELVMTCFPQDLERALALLVATVKTPALPQGDFDLQLQEARAAIGAGAARLDWEGLLRETVSETLFSGHYAAHPAEGSAESLENLDLERLAAFHRRLAVGANLVMSVYGQIDRPNLAEELAGLFAATPDLPVGRPAPIVGAPWPADLAPQTIGLTGDDQRQGLAVVWKAPSLEESISAGPAMDVLGAVLMGADGAGGRLGERLGKSYATKVLNERYMGRGAWGVLVQVPAKGQEEVRATILAEVKRLVEQLQAPAEGPEAEALDQELENARILCANRHLLADEDHGATAARDARAILLGLPLGSEVAYGKDLRAVGRKALAQVARTWLARPVLVVQLAKQEAPPPPGDGATPE